MLPNTRITGDKGINKIHQSSLEILERTGMIIDHEEALSLLAEAGCQVDHNEKRVRFPPDLVMRQARLVPKQVVLAGRAPINDLRLGEGAPRPRTRPAVGLEQLLDYRTARVQPSTTQDLVEWATVADALPNIDFNGVLSPTDVHLPSRDVSSAGLALRYTTKHLHALAYSGRSVDYLAQIAQVVAGGRDEARKRPPISFFQVCISPLQMSRTGIDCILAAGRNSIPLFLNSSPIMGATGPISIAGGVALLNAEILGMNVIHQLAHPCSPMIYTIRISAMDMKTTVSSWGMIEVSLASALSVQLAKEKYGFFVDAWGPSTESKLLDVQSAMERTWMSFLPVLAGTDILCGAGNVESQSSVNLPQLILDDGLLGTIKRMVQGVMLDDDDLAVNVIDQVGPKGHFLDTDHTFERFRTAFLPSGLFDRTFREDWENRGRPDVIEKARDRVDRILKEHQVEPLSEEQMKQIEEIVQEARVTLTTVES